MFPGYPVNSITNGIHAVTWAADPFRDLFDRLIPEWRRDNQYLRYAVGIPVGEILAAQAEYKRADLLFADPDRLRRITRTTGPLQVVYAGKAHPRDEGGKAQIRRVYEAAAALRGDVTVVYLEEYDMGLARTLCGGADVWLNTPLRPHEASGTSGMKAAVNGVPSLSVLDGWWVEGCLEGVTGWAIGEDGGRPGEPVRDATALYDKLEFVVAPLFHGRPLAFAEVMRSAIALNGSYYNAQRMVGQYLCNAYAGCAAPGSGDRAGGDAAGAAAPSVVLPPAGAAR
jgi:starch phosphorylase